MSLLARRRDDAPSGALDVRIVPMRRRHLRAVQRIEQQVYPRPWSPGVFRSELAIRDGSRRYVVAQVGHTLVGYAGLLYALEDGHITNVAVDPVWHRHKLGSRLLLTLCRLAILDGAKSLTLEVRVSNRGAQAMYQQFGFAPAGIRKKYYENVEDAIVMWATDVDTPAYAARLREIETGIAGTTTWEGLP